MPLVRVSAFGSLQAFCAVGSVQEGHPAHKKTFASILKGSLLEQVNKTWGGTGRWWVQVHTENGHEMEAVVVVHLSSTFYV